MTEIDRLRAECSICKRQILLKREEINDYNRRLKGLEKRLKSLQKGEQMDLFQEEALQ